MGNEPIGPREAERTLHFSIVIPTYARPHQLAACLDSLASLDYPRASFEVIVVNDGGGTALDAVVAPFYGRLNVLLITQAHAGPAVARNTGAARATGRYLVFIGDDCMAPSNWLHALAARFDRLPDHAIGGRIINALPHNLYSGASHRLVEYLYGHYNTSSDDARFFTPNNFGLPRARFRAIGGFDPAFTIGAGEDRELCTRWRSYGFRMTYAPEVMVYHSHPLTLRAFWRQHFTYGRGTFQHYRKRARLEMGPIRLEPVRFYLDLLYFPLRSRDRQRVSLCALLMLSQVANATGFLWQGLRRDHAPRDSLSTRQLRARRRKG